MFLATVFPTMDHQGPLLHTLYFCLVVSNLDQVLVDKQQKLPLTLHHGTIILTETRHHKQNEAPLSLFA